MQKFEHINFYLGDSITERQLAFFNQYGIIRFRNFIDKETVISFITEIEKIQQHLLENDIKKINGIPLKFGAELDGKPLIQRIAFASHYSDTLSSFLKDPRFQLLLQFLGNYEGRVGEHEKDGLVVNHYLNTASSKFTQLGWHTDSPRDLFTGSRILPMLNIGVHLDDCAFDNGGLRVLPGTHKQSLFQLLFKKKYFVDTKPDEKEAGFDIEAGDLTIHDGRIWHRVEQSPNIDETSRRRVMYIPIITGAYKPKNANSATPFYHKLAGLKLNPSATHTRKWEYGLAKKLAKG
jgi:phytanoyl-CoA hydroxylase